MHSKEGGCRDSPTGREFTLGVAAEVFERAEELRSLWGDATTNRRFSRRRFGPLHEAADSKFDLVGLAEFEER